MSVATSDIPDDDSLEDMDRNALRTLAADHSLPAGKDKDASALRRNLRRLRDGGKILRCPACERVWVYVGNAAVRTSCPMCTSSVRIERNTIGGGE